jgi:hypothetical protein
LHDSIAIAINLFQQFSKSILSLGDTAESGSRGGAGAGLA